MPKKDDTLKGDEEFSEKLQEPESTPEVVSKPEETPPESPKLFDLSKYSPKQLKAVEVMGFPLTQIANTMNTWANTVEQRFKVIIKEMPSATADLLQKRIVEAQKKQMQGQGVAPQAGGVPGLGGLSQLMPLLAPLLGGGSENKLSDLFMKQVINNGLEAMSMGTALMRGIVTKIAPEIAMEVSNKIKLNADKLTKV